MARYGFDLDGTLDNNPEVAHLARALAREGHKIYIVTASGFSKKQIAAKLYGLNVVKYHKIIRIKGTTPQEIGHNKGEKCNKHGISLYFDNDPEVLKGFAATSKIARCYVLNDDLKPRITPAPKRDQCACEYESRAFIPSRCYHCLDFLESSQMRAAHRRLHHVEDQGVSA